jgi:hypothetical protein
MNYASLFIFQISSSSSRGTGGDRQQTSSTPLQAVDAVYEIAALHPRLVGEKHQIDEQPQAPCVHSSALCHFFEFRLE